MPKLSCRPTWSEDRCLPDVKFFEFAQTTKMSLKPQTPVPESLQQFDASSQAQTQKALDQQETLQIPQGQAQQQDAQARAMGMR